MWKAAQKGWKPPTTCSEKKFKDLMYSKGESAIKGYIGHQYSFGGQWFKGYAPKYGKNINSSKASKNVVEISNTLKNVKFCKGGYEQFNFLKGYVIYCDPPYNNSKSYYNINGESSEDFDSTIFWDWCREMSKYNIIFISNYKAPRGADLIFKTDYKLTGDKKLIGKNNKRVEKLYLL